MFSKFIVFFFFTKPNQTPAAIRVKLIYLKLIDLNQHIKIYQLNPFNRTRVDKTILNANVIEETFQLCK